jgi:hypothetical protein
LRALAYEQAQVEVPLRDGHYGLLSQTSTKAKEYGVDHGACESG